MNDNNYNILFPNVNKITWKDVFYYGHKTWKGGISEFATVAKNAGYKYFCWNDRLYDTETGSCTFVLLNEEDEWYYNVKMIEEYYVNSKVKKFSGKPFKSTFKTNTVKCVVLGCRPEETQPIPAFKFEEDDSYVHCYLVETV